MDLTTNELYKHIKRKANNNLNKNIKPELPSILIKTRPIEIPDTKKEEEENIENYFKIIILNEANISNIIYNSSLNLKINICFNNLEYLSLTNNFLINLNFIINFPDLFYLDVFGNPLEEFEALNYKNTFGYLRLTVESFHEKNLLNIFGLNCSILEIDIKDRNVCKAFKLNNPNIMMINNEIKYYIDPLIEAETRKNTKRHKSINRKSVNINVNKSNDNSSSNSNFHLNKTNSNLGIRKEKNGIMNYNINKNNVFRFVKNEMNQMQIKNKADNLKLNNKISTYNNINNNIIIKNKNLLKIKEFFDELNQVITKITKKAKGKLRPYILKEDKQYLNIEKKRILLLYQIYMKLSIFNDRKKKDINEIFIKNPDAVNSNKFCDEIKIYEMKNYIKCININIRFGIIILISMLFYCLNLVSMKLAITIIHYLLLKYYKLDEHKQFQYFNTFGNIHYLCYYFDNLEDFKTKLKFAEQSQIDLYKKILDILEIPKLILNINKIKQKSNFFIKHKNISQKIRVSSLLSEFREFNMEKDILILIEFFCDFIQYENIEQEIINGSENDEYSTLIEIKELLEQKELEKNHVFISDLSVKKFYKNKLESTFNKFFFENNKIKMVKNKTFKFVKEYKKDFNKNKMNLISFLNNWNQEYKKTDDLNAENCLTIDKYITNSRTNNTFGNKSKSIKSIIEYHRNNSFFSNKNISINKENNFTQNYFSSSKFENKVNYNNIQDQNIYYKTENNNNIINSRQIWDINQENKTFGKPNTNLLWLSSKNVFNKTYKTIGEFNTINKNNSKLLSNYFNKSLTSKKTNEDRYKTNFLKTYSINKRYLREKIKKYIKNEDKKDIDNIKKENHRTNINIYRFENKKANKKKSETNNRFNGDLLVEKYNQAKQSKIIRKILEKQNKLFQEKLKKLKNLQETNKK